MMSQDHVPPQLSPEGEQLLADVLARRSGHPHDGARRSAAHRDTPTARANRVRRERDALRVPPDVTEPPSLELEEDPRSRSRGPLVGAAVLAVCLVALAFVSAMWSSPTVATEVAGATEERPATQGDVAAGDDTTATTANETSTVARSVLEGDSTDPATNAAEVVAASVIDPQSIEVSVYDEDPAINGVHSFALRVKSLSTEEEINTDAFVVEVVDDAGVASQTFSRFIHGTLPVGSSALATVRSEGAGPGQQFVVVSLGDVELARIAIDS